MNIEKIADTPEYRQRIIAWGIIDDECKELMPDYFPTDSEQAIAQAILEYRTKHGSVPYDTIYLREVLADDKDALSYLDSVDDHIDVLEDDTAAQDDVKEHVIEWIVIQAHKLAILKAANALKDGNLQLIPEIMEDAYNVALADDTDDGWDSLRDMENGKESSDYDWLLPDMISFPGLFVLYGDSGHMKTMLAQDLAICIAAGKDWLMPDPQSDGVEAIKCTQAKVLWIDVDTGRKRICQRFSALVKGHNVSLDIPLHSISFPQPDFVASNPLSVQWLIQAIERFEAGVVFIDTLDMISGDANENLGEMLPVIAGLRKVVVETDRVIIVIHHMSKSGSLRGFSGIKGHVDWVFKLDRDPPNGKTVTLSCDKTRDLALPDICALWTYENIDHELISGRFYGLGNKMTQVAQDDAELLELIEGRMNVSQITRIADTELGLRRAAVESVLKRLLKTGKVTVERQGNWSTAPKIYQRVYDTDQVKDILLGYRRKKEEV